MPILQSRIPAETLHAARDGSLPGIAPLDPADWLIVDEAYAGQMRARRALLGDRPGDVHALTTGGRAAAEELVQAVLSHLADHAHLGFRVAGRQVICPDGETICMDAAAPLISLGRILQEDLCLIEKPENAEEHILSGAVLCFPASWMLAEKIGRPLTVIHAPVKEYGPNVARRVQRLFDGVRPGRPLWRANALYYDDPALFQPRSVDDPRRAGQGACEGRYLRSERQSLWRLPRSGAVVFGIHTYVTDRAGAVTT